ncbi:MAG: MFS transporter [Kiritimatiellae bacterium]|nr:MFS transporter [Kiritimatiellia bacterium]
MNKPIDKLCNFGFIAINILVFLSFSNLAIFFSFYNYLETLPIPSEWAGALVGIVAVSALIIRPFISPILTPKNSIRWISAGLVATAISLLLYPFAQSLIPMILLRTLHGAAYVTMISASIALLMPFMPVEKSGQGFGILTITIAVPYAIVPYLLETVLADISLATVYAGSSIMMIPAALLLIPLTKHVRKLQLSDSLDKDHHTLPKGSLWLNIKHPKILCLLLANSLLFSVFAVISFFIKIFCENGHITGRPELFLAITTTTMIVERLLLNKFFDRANKALLIIISLLTFTAALVTLGLSSSSTQLYIAACIYGLGLGAASPLMNGLMFTISKPIYRGLNTNLMLEMVDSGFFIGPTLCGLALAAGLAPKMIILICAGMIMLAVTFIIPLIKIKSNTTNIK